jgi:recombination protein RecT
MSNNEVMTWIQAVDQTQDRFVSIAPIHMKFEAEKGFAVQILKNNDYLMRVAQEHPQSLQQAITNVAAIGLSLNPAAKEAYLISRTVKSGDKYQTRIFLEPSYMGMIKLATDTGSIKWVQAYPVYANDTFTFMGAGEKPEHKFNAFAKLEARGEFVGVYCVAKTAESDYLVGIMTAEQVNSVRDRSESWKAYQSGKAKTPGPRGTDFVEQAKKTVIRQSYKTWPKTDLNRLAEAVNISNENEGFDFIQTSPALGQYTAETKEYFDQLITNSDALGMFIFQHSLSDESVFTNLYHSFEKGSKGKYQAIVKDLTERGFSLFSDIKDQITDAHNTGDTGYMMQLYEELSQDGQKLLIGKVSHEIQQTIRELSNGIP